MKVLITVKTYPIPSAKYDELVCTAGVREDGGKTAHYMLRWLSTRGESGPWSETASATIGA